jgi:Fe-S-cluster containining protein
MGATCSQCGDCCEAIPFKYNKKQMAEITFDEDSPNHQTQQFVLKWWRRISRKKYVELHPEAKDTISEFFYTCLKFDPQTRLCTAHDERPPVCSNYPWYGRDPKPYGIPARCSFWVDVPAEQRPEWVAVELRQAIA